MNFRIIIASSIFLLLSCAGSRQRNSSELAQNLPSTAEFSYRGAVLGDSCKEIIENELANGFTMALQTTSLIETEEYALTKSADEPKEIVMLDCDGDMLCNMNVNYHVEDEESAIELCEKERAKITSQLGPPIIDSFDLSFWQRLKLRFLGIWDPEFLRPIIWYLDHSELYLNCPSEKSGRGFWDIGVGYSFRPSMTLIPQEDGSKVLISGVNCASFK